MKDLVVNQMVNISSYINMLFDLGMEWIDFFNTQVRVDVLSEMV